jgi:hypothetical protein
MKKLFTSYYGRRNKDRVPVQISSYAPKSWNPPGKRFEASLVWRHFRDRKTFEGDWRDDYREQLEEMLASGELAKIVERLPEGAVMLCWEKDCTTCHRTELANFVNQHGLAHVEEV